MTEDEIQYLVNEAATCLSSDIRLRRSDVLSAWQAHMPHPPSYRPSADAGRRAQQRPTMPSRAQTRPAPRLAVPIRI